LQTGAASRVATAEIQEGKVQTQPALQSRGESSMREAAVTMDVNARLEHLAVVADLYLQGQELDFRTLFPPGARRIPLPTYPFARERYWLDGAAGNVSSRANEQQPLPSFESIEALIQQIDDGSIEAHEGAQRLRALV
jgi:acyl transferase domain-containing protein